MSRRHAAEHREMSPDPVYKDMVVNKFINSMMWDGKKNVAEKIFYEALDQIKAKGDDPIVSFRKAMENVKPILEVKSRRVGGATYQIPVDVRPTRQISLAIRWLLLASRNRSGKSMKERLAFEFGRR
jgi:small subunit ribosomal protein S7